MPERSSERHAGHRLDRQLDRLLDLLVANATVVMSGRKLSAHLRVPPSTLWERIKMLRMAGVEVRGLPGSGYQIGKVPDVLTPQAIREHLRGSLFGRRIEHYYSIDSTMNEAGRLAARGAPEGTLVVAEEQTAGRGRLGRQWLSERTAGLYFTLILRPCFPPSAAPVLTLMAGIAIGEALADVTRLSTDLRWPNDVMISNKKCAGILVEMTAEPDHIEHVLVGVGINVNHREFPAALSVEATSLVMEAGHFFSRLEILGAALSRLEHYYDVLRRDGAPAIVKGFERVSSYARGKRVRVGDGAHAFTGVTEGLSAEGLLLVRRDDGELATVLAGHVRPN